MFGGGKRVEVERTRAENAERMLQLVQQQLAQALESQRGSQQTARYLQERVRALEAKLADGADASRVRELEARLEARTREAERAAALQAELAQARAHAADVERALKEQRAAADDLAAAFARLAREAEPLARYGVRATLVPRVAANGASLREAASAVGAAADAHATLARSLDDLRLGAPRAPFTDQEALRAYAKHVCQTADFGATRTALLEQARLWIEDPKLATFHVELLRPFVAAVETLLARAENEAALDGASRALRLVQEAQRQSSGYLLRRTARLDGMELPARVAFERYGQDPRHALARFQALLQQLRGSGPLDFFDNLAVAAQRALARGEPGAAYAVWLISDVSQAILDDKRVRAWIQDTAA